MFQFSLMILIRKGDKIIKVGQLDHHGKIKQRASDSRNTGNNGRESVYRGREVVVKPWQSN